MTLTPRVSRFLEALPDDDSAAILDAVQAAAADPIANPRHCKPLGAGLWEARVSLPPSRQFRVMFGFRTGEPVALSACLKKSLSTHERAVRVARSALKEAA